MINLERKWINQPSTLQPLHKLHGTNVLAGYESETTSIIYFLSGPIVDQLAPNLCLSDGWL